jgi:hypothetical protein
MERRDFPIYFDQEYPANPELDLMLDAQSAFGSPNIQPWRAVFNSWPYEYINKNDKAGQQRKTTEEQLIRILVQKTPPELRSSTLQRIVLKNSFGYRVKRFLDGDPSTLEELAETLIKVIRNQQATVDQDQAKWRSSINEEEWEQRTEERRQALRSEYANKNNG